MRGRTKDVSLVKIEIQEMWSRVRDKVGRSLTTSECMEIQEYWFKQLQRHIEGYDGQ
jgi:hypothetical protein